MDATQKITRSLGGGRLGSGNKMNISMHAYNRSTHDLSRAWRSSMNVGTLVPFISEVALNGDTWSIDLETLVRTIPTIGPLYGSFKLQLDIFSCPMRLYNGLLHNNMINIGLNMSQVKIPKITLEHDMLNPKTHEYDINNSQINASALLHYLGLRGIGAYDFDNENAATLERKFNAIPVLAYYEIYKNYYANKQEKYGYIISGQTQEENENLQTLLVNAPFSSTTLEYNFKTPAESELPIGVTITGETYQGIEETEKPLMLNNVGFTLPNTNNISTENIQVVIEKTVITEQQITIKTYYAVNINTAFPQNYINDNNIILGIPAEDYQTGDDTWRLIGIGYDPNTTYSTEIITKKFNLDEIDKARIEILKDTGLNREFSVNSIKKQPYKSIYEVDDEGRTLNYYSQNGLALKTYQSDLLQNWLNTEWIEGENGINQITAIDVSSGSFTIDALNLANKVYNMLNRIAVSGGTYEDWQEAVYSTEALRRAETPIYMGGLSTEIVFEEVVSTAATQNDPLGSLAGKGTQTDKKGGHIEIKITEPSYIIGIASITPRVDYSQGNKWDLTELDTINDLHKPALDGIGFEDLMEERAAWWGTWTDGEEWHKEAIGKTIAWVNYMTATNEVHGDFAEENKCMFMTLNRRYEFNPAANYGIEDLTTYIDPTKYNYAFADTSLKAQNFWVQIGMKIECRRVMSAKQIPNL